MSSLLRLASFFCTAVVVASFAMFASDQARHGSTRTVAQLDAADSTAAPAQPPTVDEAAPSARVERLRERRHGTVREAIDDVDDQLVGPFKGIVRTRSPWAERIFESLLALLAFGLGLGFLARYAATRGH